MDIRHLFHPLYPLGIISPPLLGSILSARLGWTCFIPSLLHQNQSDSLNIASLTTSRISKIRRRHRLKKMMLISLALAGFTRLARMSSESPHLAGKGRPNDFSVLRKIAAGLLMTTHLSRPFSKMTWSSRPQSRSSGSEKSLYPSRNIHWMIA